MRQRPSAGHFAVRWPSARSLETWPKPGLVQPWSTPASHSDMNFGTFPAQRRPRSSPILHGPDRSWCQGSWHGGVSGFIGLEARSRDVLAGDRGYQTHTGVPSFGLGLLCAAAAGAKVGGLADFPRWAARATWWVRLWGRNILDGPVQLHSHGGKARRQYGAGGARAEGRSRFF